MTIHKPNVKHLQISFSEMIIDSFVIMSLSLDDIYL